MHINNIIKLFILTLIFSFSWIILPIPQASASMVESFQVSSLNAVPIYSNTILEAGKSYLIEVSGIYTYAPGNRIADAEFAYNPDTASWYEELEVVNKEFNLDLLVNGLSQDWLGSEDGVNYFPHTYSPNHTYRLLKTGEGAPLSFLIYDSSYDWNEGTLTVSISSVLPSNKNDCKNLGWSHYANSFKNQGLCIKNVEIKKQILN